MARDDQDVKYKAGYKIGTAELIVWSTNFRPDSHIRTRFLELHMDGTLYIRPGFMSDGVSFFLLARVGVLKRAGVVHDALYWLMRNGQLPYREWEAADDEFHRVALDAGAWRWFATLVTKGLKMAAGYYAQPKNKRKVRNAP